MDSIAPAVHAARLASKDVLIAGGGLAGGLLALALAERGLSVGLVESGARLGGNHTWSFHGSDLPEAGWRLVDALVAHRWSGYEVRFPAGGRQLCGGYFSITSDRFGDVMWARLVELGVQVLLDTPVRACCAREIRLEDGRSLAARLVLDARGPEAQPVQRLRGSETKSELRERVKPEREQVTDREPGRRDASQPETACGYQKFVGLEVELSRDSALREPLLMDMSVPQHEGFRFVYVLPFSARRMLVEDTVYANDAGLDQAAFRARVLAYLAAHGHVPAAVLREEAGVLPLPWGRAAMADDPARAVGSGAALAVGYRGGWFHPVTGYSLPVAVRLALALADAADGGPHAMLVAAAEAWRRHAEEARFCRFLSQLMFTAVAPSERWRLLARFYALPLSTIQRFYALRMTAADRWRLLAGWPPPGVSLSAALRAAWGAALLTREEDT